MNKNRVGGHKRKAWRLKKKYNKWFAKLLGVFITNTLDELPKEFFRDVFSQQDYDFMRFYK